MNSLLLLIMDINIILGLNMFMNQSEHVHEHAHDQVDHQVFMLDCFSFLPQSAVDAIYDYTGTDATMHGFRGRQGRTLTAARGA